MAQISSSLTLTDGEGQVVLDALNEQFGALQSTSIGAAAPPLTKEGMLWFNTTTQRLNIRNESNTAWIALPIDLSTGAIVGSSPGSSSSAVNTGNTVTLVGGASGTGIFDANGNVSINVALNTGVGITTDSEYCPGYPYTFVSTTSWRVVGFDVRNIFSDGRRLKFIDGASIYYGKVNGTPTFTTDTTITMTMEDGAVLNSNITDVCLTQGTANWSPINQDPFSGTSINAISSGAIGANTYWIIAGDNGKVASSIDKGLTWTLASTTTTEHLNSIAYDEDGQNFLIGGNAGVLLHSTNGTTWAEDTTSIPALVTTGSGDIINVFYEGHTADAFMISFHSTTTGHQLAYSLDGTTSWTAIALTGIINKGFGYRFHGTNDDMVFSVVEDTITISAHTDTTAATLVNYTGTQISELTSANINSTPYVIFGRTNGDLEYYTSALATVADTVTGSGQINGIAHSPLHTRTIAVQDSGVILYIDDATIIAATANGWTGVTNGFNPLTNIKDVHWDGNDGMFIAVASNGQICRSSSGLT